VRWWEEYLQRNRTAKSPIATGRTSRAPERGCSVNRAGALEVAAYRLKVRAAGQVGMKQKRS
jgi:hypothetical protein